MKQYPKRPFLISGYRYEQLWLVIPFCILMIFAKGCGIIGSLIICLIGIFLIFKKKVHPIILIIVSAALGVGAGYLGELIK